MFISTAAFAVVFLLFTYITHENKLFSPLSISYRWNLSFYHRAVREDYSSSLKCLLWIMKITLILNLPIIIQSINKVSLCTWDLCFLELLLKYEVSIIIMCDLYNSLGCQLTKTHCFTSGYFIQLQPLISEFIGVWSMITTFLQQELEKGLFGKK